MLHLGRMFTFFTSTSKAIWQTGVFVKNTIKTELYMFLVRWMDWFSQFSPLCSDRSIGPPLQLSIRPGFVQSTSLDSMTS